MRRPAVGAGLRRTGTGSRPIGAGSQVNAVIHP